MEVVSKEEMRKIMVQNLMPPPYVKSDLKACIMQQDSAKTHLPSIDAGVFSPHRF